MILPTDRLFMKKLNGGRWNFSCAQPKLITSPIFHGGAGCR